MIKVLYDTPYLQLKSSPKPDGRGEWVYAHRPNVFGVIIIVPLIKKEKVLFLKTKRPPLMSEGYKGFNIELPAGLVGDEDDSETTESAIEKELLEETGLTAQKIEIVTRKLSSSAGCTSEVSSLAIAYIEDTEMRSQPYNDNGVIAERVEVALEDIAQWLKMQEDEGNTIGAQTLAGLWYIMDRGNRGIK